MGQGVAGVAEGSAVAAICSETVGTGWIDQAGELQSVIAPTRNWLVERNGTEWKSVGGKLHVITKGFALERKALQGTYAMLAAEPLSLHSARLVRKIGIGVQGTTAAVLVKLGDGRDWTGQVTPEGVATITPDRWNR